MSENEVRLKYKKTLFDINEKEIFNLEQTIMCAGVNLRKAKEKRERLIEEMERLEVTQE